MENAELRQKNDELTEELNQKKNELMQMTEKHNELTQKGTKEYIAFYDHFLVVDCASVRFPFLASGVSLGV